MSWIGKLLKTDKKNAPLPQYYNTASDDFEIVQGSAGAINVRVIEGGSGGGEGGTAPAPVDVTLQNAVLAPGTGTSYTPVSNVTLTFVVSGTSTSRTVVFEMADPVTGTYVSANVFGVTDPSKFGTSTTSGNNAAPEGWQIDIPAGWSFRTRVTAVAGGNVTIKGKAVM